MFYKNKKIKRDTAGFTLLELMVVITLSTIITTALIIQNSRWNDRMAVTSQAYELVLMIRQAQIWGLSVRENSSGVGDRFNVGYGIYIDEDNPSNQYVFFVDQNKDGVWSNGETLETKTLTRGVVINRFCGSTGGNNCNNGPGPLNQLNIVFFRPETKANISLLNNGGGPSTTNPPVTIYLRSPQGNEVGVFVDTDGRVSVQ